MAACAARVFGCPRRLTISFHSAKERRDDPPPQSPTRIDRCRGGATPTDTLETLFTVYYNGNTMAIIVHGNC